MSRKHHLVVTMPCELLVKLQALRWDHCPEITGQELTAIWDLNITIKEERQTFAYRPKRRKAITKQPEVTAVWPQAKEPQWSPDAEGDRCSSDVSSRRAALPTP